MVAPSQAEIDRRRIIGVNKETVTNITSTDFPHHHPGEDNSWDPEKFAENFNVQFHTNQPHDASFSLISLDASIANAFRRILLAEIPTLAIEDVFVTHNTSLIQDEVLAHRLGLVPLHGPRTGLHWLKWLPVPPSGSRDLLKADYNTIVLTLDVACTWLDASNPTKSKDRLAKGERDPDKLFANHAVYARDLHFAPHGQQPQHFPDPGIAPVNPDILLAKLRPGQAIRLQAHAIKGIGADHAKFSPVATASYRLLPRITLTRPILGADAKKFARCFPRGVIGLERVSAADAAQQGSGYEGQEGELKAVVRDPMRDTVSRECLRHEEFKDKVRLGRVRDHFIFRVESTGQFESDELFLESVRLLRIKCERMKRAVDNLSVA